MSTTDLPRMIRECVDNGVTPATCREIRARAELTRRTVRTTPAPRRTRVAMTATGLAATGLAAAGIAGAVIAGQSGSGAAPGTRTVLTAAVLRHMASASQAAMTSGRADIHWTSGGSTVDQQIAFDGGNWQDTSTPSGSGRVPAAVEPVRGAPGSKLRVLTWRGATVEKTVDGKDYHYPAFAWKPRPHIVAGWMRIIAPGAGAPLDIPDPRTLLRLLSPAGGFVNDGYSTVDGVRLRHLRATTPGAVPAAPLNAIIQSEPSSPRLSALDLWVNQSGVVVRADLTVSGQGTATELTAAGRQAMERYLKAHDIKVHGDAQLPAAYQALEKLHPGLGKLLGQPGMTTTARVHEQGVSVAVTFSQIGQPQGITAPPIYTTVGGKG
jgi:hypothetical protein